MGKVGYCCFQETLILSLQNPILLGFLTWFFIIYLFIVILVGLEIQFRALCVLHWLLLTELQLHPCSLLL